MAKITLPKSTSARINLMFSDKDTSLESLRERRDLAVRDGDLKLAMACAYAIDQKKMKRKPKPKPAVSNRWMVEYEIVPLRAIYRKEMSGMDEKHVRQNIKRSRPTWTIRSIKKLRKSAAKAAKQ